MFGLSIVDDMETYRYKAIWADTDPDPRGLWFIRVYDPETDAILICERTGIECSLTVVGTASQAEIEVAVVEFLQRRADTIALHPDPVIGEVSVSLT